MNGPDESVCCDYCGLPLAAGWFGRSRSLQPASVLAAARPVPATPLYCCSGCRLAAEIASEGQIAPTALLTRLGFAIFLTMNVVCFTMYLWSEDVYIAEGTETSRAGLLLADLFRYLSMLFSLPVAYLLAGPLARNAWQQLRRGTAATDLLLVLGVFAAFAYSILSVLRGHGHIYFEVGCVVLVFVTLGRWLETTGRQQAGTALDALAKLLPAEVRKWEAGTETLVPLDTVLRGDRLRLLAGERVPTDCRIVSGNAAIDEQLITGESLPAVKEPGDLLYGGTLNLDGSLIIEVVAAPSEGTLHRLVEAVATARRTKGRYQRMAEHVACWFLPLATMIALGTFVVHFRSDGFERGLLSAMSVVLIACPCALGLATPLAVWSALGAAARSQILFRHGEALERLAAVDLVLFDKTGTLSTGHADVLHFVVAAGEDAAVVQSRAAHLAHSSTHPLSRALCDYLGPTQIESICTDLQTYAGRGVLGRLPDRSLCLIGNSRWMKEMGQAMPPDLRLAVECFEQEALAIACIAWQGRIRAVYACGESLRSETSQVIAQLKRSGLELRLLSGDHAIRAARIGESLGIAAQAEMLPENKVAALRAAHREGRTTAMVGDGINDAPALASADVGIAMGCGADVSREAADVCLLSSNLTHLVTAVELARRTVRVIRQNLFWAFFYNVVGIGLACTGKLNPMWAAVAMTLSSIMVVANSLRLGAKMETEPAQRRSPSPVSTAVERARCSSPELAP